MDLPPDVRVVRAKGRAYYYFQKGRGTASEGPRIALGRDPTDPVFWAKIKDLRGDPPPLPAVDKGTIGALIREFKASPEWRAYEPATHRDYSFYLQKLEDHWGPLPAAGLMPSAVLALRDSMSESPGSANHMLSIGKTLFKWGIPREYAVTNPFREIAKIKDEDDGHWPWPDWAREHVAQHAPPDIARFVYLAAQTGLRESDVVRLGPSAMDGKGLWVRPKKTKKKRAAFWVPLLTSAQVEIEQWQRQPLVFHLPRRKAPLLIEPGVAFVLSPAGNPYTPEGLRSRWNRWIDIPAGAALIERWSAWMRARLERDGEDVAPDATFKPTLHGLRSTAVAIRRQAGYQPQQISNDIGMSLSMVTRYSRFMDQREAAESNIVVLENAAQRRLNR